MKQGPDPVAAQDGRVIANVGGKDGGKDAGIGTKQGKPAKPDASQGGKARREPRAEGQPKPPREPDAAARDDKAG